MKKPAQYELKKWLCNNLIVGLKVHYYQISEDQSDTDWEMIPNEGKPKRVKAASVKDLVTVAPDWAAVLRVNRDIADEMKEWAEFAKKEANDLLQYERLKKKFET